MEVLLNSKTETVHRFSKDLDDYTLIHSSEMASCEDHIATIINSYDSDNGDEQALYEYLITLNSDKPVNIECLTGVWVIVEAEIGVLAAVPANVYAELPDGGIVRTVDDQTVFLGDWNTFSNLTSIEGSGMVGFTYRKAYFNSSFPLPLPVQVQAFLADLLLDKAEYTSQIVFRNAKTTTSLNTSMIGNSIRINVGEFDGTPANYELKVYRKTLVEGTEVE